MGRWELSLKIDPDSRLPLSLQIARSIAADVRHGRLRPGSPIPGTRTLAGSLHVSRNTVFAAYEELAAEGWITASRTRGTFICDNLPSAPPGGPPKKSPGLERIGFDLRHMQTSNVLARPYPQDALRWDFGVPDVRLAPTQELARAYRRVLQNHAQAVLQYDRYLPRSLTSSRLQIALATMLSSTRGIAVDPANVVVTRGSQMAIYLVARTLISAGDVVAVENPGYYGAWEVFRAAGARVVPIAVDECGLRVDALKELLAREPVRAVFLTPHHQFPTTVMLSMARRLELIALASARRFAIIEDDYDHEFHYDGRPVLPMASLDTSGVVLYVGSLSKIFAPGVRTGYLVAPTPMVGAVGELRKLIDLQNDQTVELALAELVEDGEMQRHLGRARRIYRLRRDYLVEALRRQLGGVLDFEVPSGGMAIWARVDPAVDVEAWAERAVAHGVVFRTGSIFSFDQGAKPFVRLGFARLNEPELKEALRRVVKALPPGSRTTVSSMTSVRSGARSGPRREPRR